MSGQLVHDVKSAKSSPESGVKMQADTPNPTEITQRTRIVTEQLIAFRLQMSQEFQQTNGAIAKLEAKVGQAQASADGVAERLEQVVSRRECDIRHQEAGEKVALTVKATVPGAVEEAVISHVKPIVAEQLIEFRNRQDDNGLKAKALWIPVLIGSVLTALLGMGATILLK